MKLNRRMTILVLVSVLAAIGISVEVYGSSRCSAPQQVQQPDPEKSEAKPINVWRGLVPLSSTKSDVERLFGKPSSVLASRPVYSFEKENVLFTYAQGNCDPQDSNWNVPPGTILEIEIVPQVIISVNDLGFDLRKFRDEKWDHPESLVYTNIDEGVTIRTRTIEIPNAVTSIKLSGSSHDLKLACKPSETVKPANQKP
ncbi:MAG TPA: hypothetical protein VJP89_15635 [Pyrinomonadaceae bacterium]|nr:hypothetical protein [Pyrinomonadaceae bacterium]